MAKWEYREEYVTASQWARITRQCKNPKDALVEVLNDEGARGWELIGIEEEFNRAGLGGVPDRHFLWKRKIVELEMPDGSTVRAPHGTAQ